MSFELSYAFTILFMTLGPVKTIPAFAMISADLDEAATRSLALRGFLIATLLVFATALVFSGKMTSWRISAPAMQIAGGLLLFASASRSITAGLGGGAAGPKPPSVALKSLDDSVKARALAPLAIPSIITPFAIVAILVLTNLASDESGLLNSVYGFIGLMMVANLIGMWFAKPMVRAVGISPFRTIGWIMSVLQAGLAVQSILNALRALKVIPSI